MDLVSGRRPRWRTWSGSDECRPRLLVRPHDMAEVAETVVAAASRDLEVRVAGAGHSFGDHVCTDGVLLTLERMDRVLEWGEDTVTVEAGTSLRSLHAALAERGRALANVGAIDPQSVAGALSTGTHGTGSHLPNLSSQVVALEIVRADGQTIRVDAGAPEVLAAARLSLGALGVIVSVTLRTVPAYALRGRVVQLPLAAALDALDELCARNRHCELLTYPYSPIATVRTMNVDPDPPPLEPTVQRSVTMTQLVNRWAWPLAGMVASRSSARALAMLGSWRTRKSEPREMVAMWHRALVGRSFVRGTSTEWALPRETAQVAAREVIGRIESRRLPADGPVQLRFGPADHDAWLSPTWGRDSAYLGTTLRCSPGATREIIGEFRDVARAHAGRPHWGKDHGMSWTQLRDLVPEWDRFQEVRSKLDPIGMFTNAHVRRVLGPVS